MIVMIVGLPVSVLGPEPSTDTDLLLEEDDEYIFFVQTAQYFTHVGLDVIALIAQRSDNGT